MDYHDRLLQIGTGWLGWTERETLETAIPTIELAYDGLVEKLRAIHGGGSDKPAPEESAEPASGKAVLDVFRHAATKPQRGL